MTYTHQRVLELVQGIQWSNAAAVRLFWVRHSEGPRDEFAAQLARQLGEESVVALVVRKRSFYDANSVLADVSMLIEDNRPQIRALARQGMERLTILLIAKDEFRLINASSPITLPTWFPVRPGLETFFSVRDLALTAEAEPLSCPEARLGQVSELFFELETSITSKLREIHALDGPRALRFLQTMLTPGSPALSAAEPHLSGFEQHLEGIGDPRAYRPNCAAESTFLSARLLKLALGNSPKQLGKIAADLASHLVGAESLELKPTYFAISWRPAAKMTRGQANLHGILVGMFQAYQLMNASAHAGEYPRYSVALQHASSIDLRTFLHQAREYVEQLS
jgi:hypothetical protein